MLPLPTIFIFYYASSVPTTVTVEVLLAVVTRSCTSVPEIPAEIDDAEPFVPTIPYSVIAMLSEASSVKRTFEISVCDP